MLTEYSHGIQQNFLIQPNQDFYGSSPFLPAELSLLFESGIDRHSSKEYFSWLRLSSTEQARCTPDCCGRTPPIA